jgi:hypothetical protein
MNRPSNEALGDPEPRQKLVRSRRGAQCQKRGQIARPIDVLAKRRAREHARHDARAMRRA